MKLLKCILTFDLVIILTFTIPAIGQEAIKLIVRGDDMGFCHATNEACIKAYQEGILTSTEVLVNGPWFLDAAEMLCDNPGLDVGAHLTLTSEWANYKWGPITNSSSLVDEDGYFPLDKYSFAALNPSSEEIEMELRRQIQLAIEHIPTVSHLSFHMGTAIYNAEWTEITYNLSVEYNLPMVPYGEPRWVDVWGVPVDNKENAMNALFENLQRGLTVIVCHPSLDNAETQAIKGSGNLDPNVRMSVHRQAETDALCSDRIKQTIVDHNIQLVSYLDTYNTFSVSSIKPTQQAFILQQNYPNPFNPATTIKYFVNEPCHVRLQVYSVLGDKVFTLVDEFKTAGEYQIEWIPENITSGIYFARLMTGGNIENNYKSETIIKKMIYLK
ncbi:MAG: ChbG/HpnK family deacetylase [bacterium]